jgi:DnaJ family protein A protein 2
LCRYKRPFDKGDLYISFQLKFPEAHWATAPQIALLDGILPPRTPLPDVAGEREEVVLSTVDPLQQQANERRYQDMDEDDEGGGEGPGVQV